MIAAQAGEAIHGLRVMPGELEIALCASHEESARVGYQDAPGEVHIASIQQIEGACFEQQTVEPAHIVVPRTGNADARWNRSAQIDLGMKLDARLGLTEIAPWKKRQRQVDGRGVECVDRVVQIQAKILARIERSGFLHQTLGEGLPRSASLVFRWHRREWILQPAHRIQPWLPPQATEISLLSERNGHYARYKVEEDHFMKFLDGLWEADKGNSAHKRDEMGGEGEPGNPERIAELFKADGS